jgi:erythromycin esterase
MQTFKNSYLIKVAACFVLVIFGAQFARAEVIPFGPISRTGGVFQIPDLNLSTHDPRLKPILALANSVSIIGMGEPAHASHEVHVARTLFIKTLVESSGYRAIGFEAPWLTVRRADEYVKTCSGNPKVALRGLGFPAWFDEATLDLLQWICRFNSAHSSNRVRLFGFDIQVPRHEDREFIEGFFAKYDPGFEKAIHQNMQSCVGWNFDELKQVTQTQVNNCQMALEKIEKQLKDKQPEYQRASSKEKLLLLSIANRSLNTFQLQALYYNQKVDQAKGQQVRDANMAENFEQIRNFYFPNAKTILYAHNWHMAKNTIIGNYPDWAHADSIGSIIHKKHPGQYAALGLIGYDVRANPIVLGGEDQSIPIPTSENSIELALHRAGLSFAFVKPAGLFVGLLVLRDILDIYVPGARIPGNQYDLLFFLNYSGPLVCPKDVDCSLDGSWR